MKATSSAQRCSVSAADAAVNNDGTINLHIGSTKFGKLTNGTLVEVEHSLIKQHQKHVVDLTFGVKIILAMNGSIWLEPNQLTENAIDQIARLKNIIQTLAQNFVCIRVEQLLELYNHTATLPVQSLSSSSARETILAYVAQIINTQNVQNVNEIIRKKVEDRKTGPAEDYDQDDY